MKKTECEFNSSKNKKTVITVIICASPFVLLTMLTGTCLSKLHFFSWMLEHYYMFVWVAALILAWFSPYRAVYLSYAFPVTVILGQFLGDCIDEYRKSQMTHEELLRFTTRNFPVWVYSFLIAIALFELALAARSCYRRVQGKEGAAKRVLTYVAVCLVPFPVAFLVAVIPGLGADGFSLTEQLAWIFLVIGLVIQFYKPATGLAVSFSYCSVVILMRLICGIFGLFSSQGYFSFTALGVSFVEMILFAALIPVYKMIIQKKI